jgi:CheY-like chemotaxis protein
MWKKSRESILVGESDACATLQSSDEVMVLEARRADATSKSLPTGKRLLRVLVVDDDQDTADSLSMLVQIWGHDVRRAYGGAAALKITAAYQPDVLLLDIGMPGMDGCRLAQELRRQARFKDTLLIAVTGFADQAHRLLGEEAGFDLYLIKPVAPLTLETLLMLLEKGRLADSPREPLGTAKQYGILVVDDEEAVRNVLGSGLRQSGFAVWLAANGPEALDLYWRHREGIDLVLLDVRMHGLDGPRTLAALKELNPRIRCCFMSGDLGNNTEEKLYNLGAAAVLSKPFRLAEVAQTLW